MNQVTPPQKKIRLLILASGTGSLFLSIVEACKNSILHADVIALISNKQHALVVTKANHQNIPVKILNPQDFSSLNEWDKSLYTYLQTQNPDFILLAGFLKKIGKKVLSHFKNRIINIHPSLLPRHGGLGMYGLNVHKAVLNSGDKNTGITVHLVSENYDTGCVLEQIKIPVSPQDTPISLQKKVKTKEQEFYISVLNKIINKHIKIV